MTVPAPGLGGCCCQPRGSGAGQSLPLLLPRVPGGDKEQPPGQVNGEPGWDLCRSGRALGGWIGRWMGGWTDGWMDGLGCLTQAERPASSSVPEAQERFWPGHADPTMSQHMASTVAHHASPTTSHHETATASHCAAPTMSHCSAPTPPAVQQPLHPTIWVPPYGSHHIPPSISHHVPPSSSLLGGNILLSSVREQNLSNTSLPSGCLFWSLSCCKHQKSRAM